MLVALKGARRNAVLDLWFAGKRQGEILDLLPEETESSVQYYVRVARKEGDARAVPRCTVNRYADLIDQHRDDVLTLVALGEGQAKIAKALGIEFGCVRSIVDRARRAGDPRAERRLKADREAEAVSLQETESVETLEVYSTDAALFGQPKPVSVKKITFGEHASLRPIAYSIEREQSRERSTTAMLMGDPSPERSALKRPLRPDEWASRGGEGRYRDNRGGYRPIDHSGQAPSGAGALAMDRLYEQGTRPGGQPRRGLRLFKYGKGEKHVPGHSPLHGGKETN